MNKSAASMLLALALSPAAALAHGVHGEPVPTVYYTPESAYYVADHTPTSHTVVQQAVCGCCACPMPHAAAVPTGPVIVRSVMPVYTDCGHAYHQTSNTYVAPTYVEPVYVEPAPAW